MAASALIERATDPRLRGLAYRFGRGLASMSPVFDLDDLVQELALGLLELAHRRPDAGMPDLRLLAVDGARRILGRGERTGRGSQAIPLDEVRGRHGFLYELAAIPELEPLEDPDEENMRHRIEWETMGLHERQTRILESRRALLCSI